MCGICGIFEIEQKVNENIIPEMLKLMKHRGPDAQGIAKVGDKIILGHTRLKIIDLSDKANQPMRYKNLWITLNGEIYNFKEIRKELEKKGHIFLTDSDTEVLLHSFEEWGEKCLSRFNGMWSFCITDGNFLFCSRDRFGIKPFYYYWDGKIFAFASEIKALLLLPFIKREINKRAVWDYFMGFLEHSDFTFFKNIKILPPAHYIKITKDKFEIKRYWKPQYIEIRNPFEELYELLSDAVKLRLRTDVPLGTALSGGIDSSCITYLLHKIRENPDTFTVIYDEKNIDESEYAKEMIRFTGSNPHFVKPSGEKFWQEVEKVIWHHDMPFMTTSHYAEWCLMRLASETGVKVLLSGQGADELFCGYTVYHGVKLSNLFFSGHFLKFIRYLYRAQQNTDLTIKELIYRFSRASYFNQNLPFQRKITEIGRRNILKFLKKDFKKEFTERADEIGKKLKKRTLNKVLWDDASQYNLPELLHYGDRNSMAFSIELRVPFLDYRIANFAYSLSEDLKLCDGISKYILRKSFENKVPDKIIKRKDKKGFPTPEKNWLLAGKEKIKEILKNSSFFDDSKIEEIFHLIETDVPTAGKFIFLEAFIKCFNLKI